MLEEKLCNSGVKHLITGLDMLNEKSERYLSTDISLVVVALCTLC
ncbi:hypothetical protein TcasGA2_TC031724 [Tribolium castaneum]|uniref:Uncharacterized protein n=1 Tax=Tribolium castaneum TaxID=7070 RepID=A0A139W8U4_TRICA|nr:hypothetical protein TcasGA2_TC031724 [Tribolium castaneum]